MKTYITLLRRELWENRGSFMTTPVVIGGLILFIAIVGAGVGLYFGEKIDPDGYTVKEGIQQLNNIAPDEIPEARVFFTAGLWGVTAILNLGLTFVIFFYLLGALYDDRRDGSVMFWRSLPVSDLATVLSKLLAAIILAPAVTLACIIITHVGLLLIGAVIGKLHGLDVLPFLGIANPVPIWPKLFVAYLLQGLWALPVYGWLLLVSSAARSKPFLWAFLPPLLIGVLIGALKFARTFSFDGYFLIEQFFARLFMGVLPIAVQIDDEGVSVGDSEAPLEVVTYETLFRRLLDSELWIGVLVGAAFIAAAIYVRRYRTDN